MEEDVGVGVGVPLLVIVGLPDADTVWVPAVLMEGLPVPDTDTADDAVAGFVTGTA